MAEMILSRFFKPKWQHPNPEVRKQALQGLSSADPILVRAAREDLNPGVRRSIVHRITDLNLLQQIALEDPEIGVRETAEARLRRLMTGQEPDSPSLEIRLVILAQSPAAGLADFLVVHGAEPQLRLIVLGQVEQDALLGKVAINDPAAEVRLAAVERIRAESTLKEVIKQTRKRDKRVYRGARERLEALQAERERAARSAQLCAELEALAADFSRVPDAGRFHTLEAAWETQQQGANNELRERYQGAREQFLARLHKSAARRRRQLERCQSLQDLLQRLLAETELTPELAVTLDHALQAIAGEQMESAAPRSAEEQRFSQLVQAIKDQEWVLQRNHERAARLRALVQETETLLHQPGEVHEGDLSALQQRWGSLERPEAPELMVDLQAQFEALLNRLRTRLSRQVEQRDQERAEITALVAEVEAALAQGTLQQALSLHDRARQRLRRNISLSPKQMAALEERLQACTPRMGELRDWRRWGTNQAREHLCEEVEELPGSDRDPVEMARQIKRARATWKAMDSAQGPAPRVLWERFNQACERAYQPCQAYFDARFRERQENLEKKQALCQGLEQFEATTDWDQADWRAVDRLRREFQQQWRSLGPVNRVDKKALEQRYNQALKGLDVHLDRERERELRRRQALIQRLQGLADSEDIQMAMAAARQAQAEWQPTVMASRRKEQALWRAFRAACDAIFERRQTERQAADAERQTNLVRKTRLCEEIDALALGNDEALVQSRHRVQQIRQEWTAIGAVPKADHREIEQGLARVLQRFEQRCQELQQARERQELQGLRDRARLCARIESLLPTEQPAEAINIAVDQTRQAWESLPPLQASLEEASRRRLVTACQAVTGDSQNRQALLQTLEENLHHRRGLCLRMELLAGVETPPEFAQEKMEYQVSRLSEAMLERSPVHSRHETVDDEVREIEREWYLLGALPSALNDILESRFARALDALYEPQNH